MGDINRHIIRKQIIELELPNSQKAWQLQQKASRLFQEKIKEKLEPVFDKLNVAGTNLRIPQLEIDLGTIPPSQFEQVFVEKCVGAIEEALGKEVAKFNIEQENNATKRVDGVGVVFFYFLENGVLPWYANFDTIEALERAVSKELEIRKNEFKIDFISSVKKNPSLLTRLTRQFSIPFMETLLSIIWGYNPIQFQAIQQNIKKLIRQNLSIAEERLLCLALFKEIIFEEEIKADVLTNLIDQIKQISLYPKNKSEEKIMESLMRQQIFVETSLSVQKLKDRFFQRIKSGGRTKKIDNHKAIDSYILDESAEEKLNDIIEPSLGGEEEKEGFPEEGLYVENAGLVICAHFLKILFTGFELLEKDVFINDAAQNRALALSQYLVTGEENSAEFLLALNKVLCGIPLSAPINRMTNIKPKEKEEAENLLNHLIKHWTILGNSSIESLRNTFLKRKGKLTYEKHRSTWLLQIEKTGFDICVERLPWTISIIKLPWMKEALHVDWV